MVKTKMLRVSTHFADYCKAIRDRSKSNGREYSIADITEILAQFRPEIKVEEKERKRRSILDF